ncbi:MAG: amino acid adenylation domain-containing protein, partial [Acidobacteriota bacterium]
MREKHLLFTSRVYKEYIFFWQEQLAKVNEVEPFQISNKLGDKISTTRVSHCLQLGEETRNIITRLANRQDLGTFVVLLSAFLYLAGRFSDRRIVPVKTPLLNNITGEQYSDDLLLIEGVDDSLTIKQLLINLRQTVSQSYRFQNFPLSFVTSKEQDKVLNRINILIQYSAIHCEYKEVENYDLILEISKVADELLLTFHYRTAILHPLFISAFARCYENTLRAYVNPQTILKDIELLSASERYQLLYDFNDTRVSYPYSKTIHELFAQQVELTPEQTAVIFQDQALTYCELNQQANQLAHYLRESCNIRADELVGLMMNRSENMIIALLAILKAGGAYLPIDPNYPQERIDYLLKESRLKALLIDSEFLFKVEDFDRPVFALDLQLRGLSDRPTVNLENINTAMDLAYVMYTSGSTGEPKGVEVTHRGVVRLVKENHYASFSSEEIFLQFAPISFDASTFEIWGCLLNGSKLVVMPVHTPTLDELELAIKQQGITTLWLTAGLFHLIVDERLKILQSIKQLLAGGDILSVPQVNKFIRELPDSRLTNGYGPTESTTFACCYDINSIISNGDSIPIGRPIANTQVYLLDRHLQLVPIGVPGELYIGGDGIARGYHNAPDLTATKFLPHPFSYEPGARLYKTGDWGYYLENGVIQFIGRFDNQVKVRGFRIELSEIEAVLAQHTAIMTNTVVVREDKHGEKRLVAYVVCSAGNNLSKEELRQYLAERVPDYMLPTAYVFLDALPLTSNGKVDRRALPVPAQEQAETNTTFSSPRTPEEEILAGCWAQALDLTQVSIDDNFFALGGDSIRAIQMLSRAHEQGLHCSLQQLFQYQTIRKLAQELKKDYSSATNTPQTYPFCLISEEDREKIPLEVEDAYPLTMLQMGMVFHSEYSQQSSVYHDVFSCHLRAKLDVKALETAMRQLISSHPILRTSFGLTCFSEPLQLVHKIVSLSIQTEDISCLSTAQQEEMLASFVKYEKSQDFNWNKPPLLRLFLHCRNDQAFQFTLSFHHAILDGWSLASFLTELFQLYVAILENRSGELKIEPVASFRDFIKLEREAMSSEMTRDYWRRRLVDAPVTLLPRCQSIPLIVDDSQIGMRLVSLTPEVSDNLRHLAQSVAVPVKSVLLAAHLRVLSLLTGQSDIVTGLVSNGRPETGNGDRILGLFLNTLPFRQQLFGGSWLELVQETFKHERELLPLRYYPLARIQSDLGGNSLFEVAFNFVHFHVYK